MLTRVLLLLFAAGGLLAQTGDHPITSLPYTPSLDLSSMDRSVDPCVNFYHYSCGGWIKKNPIPPDQPRWDVYSKLTQDNQLFLWGILEEAAKPRRRIAARRSRRSATTSPRAWTSRRSRRPARRRSSPRSTRSRR